jgi:general secretion pathway protein J
MTRTVQDREAGFALVESIAVLALSSLVLLTMLIATDLVSRNSAAAARRANSVEMLTTGLAAVRRDLEETLFLRSGPEPEDPLLFSGQAGSVALARADDGSGNTGEGLVLIEARYEAGRGVLVRSAAPMKPATRGFGGVAFANHAVLVSGPWKYRFAYADPKAEAERWRSTWSEEATMPSAVRLEILDRNDNRVVPPLVVRLHVDSSGCAGAGQAECEAKAQADQPLPEEGDVPEPGQE